MPRDHPLARLRVLPRGAGTHDVCGPAEAALIMERVCFLLRVRPDRLDEYKARHREVWPEMLDALRETGWRDYSLFLRDDGLLVGYLECDDFEASVKAMEEREVNARWQAEMTPFFELSGDERPDTGLERLEEVFHLA
jgi:L-rhamnose mutarotase